MNNFLYPVTSDPAVNFLEGLAQNVASAMNQLYGAAPVGSRRFYIRALTVLAKENFGPEVNLFSSAAGNTTSLTTNTFLGRWGFLSANGERINGTGLYNYYVDGLAIPYVDDDTVNTVNPPSLHVILQNLSATAKSADATGATKVTIWIQPQAVY